MLRTVTVDDQNKDEESTPELAAKKSAVKKPAAKKSTAKKPAAKKSAAKKTTAKKPAAKKSAAKKTAAKKSAAKKPAAKKRAASRKEEAVADAQESDATLSRVLLDIETDRAERLAIATTSGDIRVEAHDVPRIIVETSNGTADLSGVDISIGKNKTVYAGIKNSGKLRRMLRRRKAGDANMIVKIPADFSIEVRSDSGNISVDGIEGRVKAVAAKGDVTLKDVNGKVSVRTWSGNISGNAAGQHVRCTTLDGNIDVSGLAGSMKCKSWSGDINLEWVKTPEVATVDVGTGGGALDVRLPGSTQLNYQFIVGLASIMNEFEQAPDSNFKMRVVSKRGPLSLRKAAR